MLSMRFDGITPADHDFLRSIGMSPSATTTKRSARTDRQEGQGRPAARPVAAPESTRGPQRLQELLVENRKKRPDGPHRSGVWALKLNIAGDVCGYDGIGMDVDHTPESGDVLAIWFVHPFLDPCVSVVLVEKIVSTGGMHVRFFRDGGFDDWPYRLTAGAIRDRHVDVLGIITNPEAISLQGSTRSRRPS